MKTNACFSFALGLSLLTSACGQQESSSQLSSSVPHHACTSSAYNKRDAAYVQAQKNFDANAAACYQLLDAGLYLPVSLCLKAAEASRKDELSKADLGLELDLSSCQELPAL